MKSRLSRRHIDLNQNNKPYLIMRDRNGKSSPIQIARSKIGSQFFINLGTLIRKLYFPYQCLGSMFFRNNC
jgi:hypothetical protein